ncbi:MAG: hypothetical protein ACT4QG_14470 [Sporichthyaceae bacterium]
MGVSVAGLSTGDAGCRLSPDRKPSIGRRRPSGNRAGMANQPSFPLAGPFLRREAKKSGLSRRRLDSGDYASCFRGVLLPSDRPVNIEDRCRAARLVVPGRSLFSHHTAAELYKIPAPRDTLIHLSLISEIEPRIQGISAHRVLELPAPHWVHGLPVTSPGRTFVDLASRLDLPNLVAAGDGLARLDGTTDNIADAISAGSKRRGIRLAREAYRYLDPRAASAPESHLRLLLTQAGFPPDLVNEPIADENGLWIAEPDLGYWVRLALEYEGRHHQSDHRQWESDIDRDARYQASDWHLIKVTSTMLYHRPQQLVARVANVLRARGFRPARPLR